MKLQFKIFISILIVSLTTLFISSYYLINRSHLDNITREQERSLNEFTFIQSTLENGIDFSTSGESLKLLLSRYADYYAQRDIILMIFNEDKPVYSDFSGVKPESFSELLSVKKGTNQIQIIKENNKHFFFVAGRFTEAVDYVLVYARDISEIYQNRTLHIYLSLTLSFALILLLSFLSFIYSRWITKPIVSLNHSAVSISQGDYTIRIPDTKDEFQTLGTAFNQMASAVEARTSELEEKAKELQVFIDDLSHEMNTPLTSIQGYSEFLLNANATEEQKQKATETIRQEAKRMKDIYTKLMALTFAREHELELVEVKIEELFSDLQDSFSLQLQDHNISLDMYNKLDSLPLDKTLIHMLLSNLIKNSIQALPNGGQIKLLAYTSDDKTVVEVSDNGYGIPKDKINEVTKPFFRVDKSRSRKTGGAGLGLSICKSIASLHHADMVIESQEGIGTSIKIIFYNSVTTPLSR